jgi:hypothetical protein
MLLSDFNAVEFWRVDDPKTSNNIPDSTFQAAASWQANKNFLLKVAVILEQYYYYSYR